MSLRTEIKMKIVRYEHKQLHLAIFVGRMETRQFFCLRLYNKPETFPEIFHAGDCYE
jgi:hypothetical protein